MDMNKALQDIRNEAKADFESALLVKDIEALKVKYFGKKGLLQGLMQTLKDCSPEERPLLGKGINDLKTELEVSLTKRLSQLEEEGLQKQFERDSLDVTLPGRRNFLGSKHVVLKMLDEAIEVLVEMGFKVQLGPDIDTEYYNFEALNFSKDHPARDMQDTYYITSDVLLRTHTSNVEVRVMESGVPPIRVISPGKCYRNEDVSARSHVVFHQIEGLYVAKNVSFLDLFATLEEFFGRFFGRKVEMRFRPSYFPFVEPGMEVDVKCLQCDGVGCQVCKKTGWLEVAGAGMTHPEVLKSGGVDPEEYSGFAWGMGIERLAMLRHGIPDIRLFLENNLRFLEQF